MANANVQTRWLWSPSIRDCCLGGVYIVEKFFKKIERKSAEMYNVTVKECKKKE